MAQVIGLAKSSGTIITALAFFSSQSLRSGVARIEQMRMMAVSKQDSVSARMPTGMDVFRKRELDLIETH
jgi:hypothetical protein